MFSILSLNISYFFQKGLWSGRFWCTIYIVGIKKKRADELIVGSAPLFLRLPFRPLSRVTTGRPFVLIGRLILT